MNSAPIAAITAAIRATHGGEAKLSKREWVHETFEGETVWEGEVMVFQLVDHPEADRCYCWELDGDVTCVLGIGPVKSAVDAVRAAIMSSQGPSPEAG